MKSRPSSLLKMNSRPPAMFISLPPTRKGMKPTSGVLECGALVTAGRALGRNSPMLYAARGTIAAPTVQLNHKMLVVLAQRLLRAWFTVRQPW
jgi:hypothetical protein